MERSYFITVALVFSSISPFRVLNTPVKDDIITKTGLETIQTRINEISVLSDIGRLPGNIKSNYRGFTAAQWKNFFSQCIASRMYSLISISTIGNLLSLLAVFSAGHA